MSSVQVHGLCFQWNSPQHLLMLHPNGNGLQFIEILKPSPVYLKIIRGKHSVTSLSCNSFTLTEIHCLRAGQQCNFPNTASPRSRAGPQQVCNIPLTVWRVLCGLQKQWSPWHYPQTDRGRGKCHHRSASEGSCRQEAPSWLNCFSPTFWVAHPEAAAGGKGGYKGFPWGATTSTQTKAAAELHLTPFPGGKGVVFKSFPPHYPGASGTQPCDITVWTRLSQFSQSTLCTGVLCPSVIPMVPLSFHLLYTCLCRYIETNCFVFSCLQENLISVRPLLPITPVTHHWRQEHRDCRKIYIYIYIHNWIQFHVFKFRKKCTTYTHQDTSREY